MDRAPSDSAFFDAARLVRLPRVSSVAPSPCGTWLAVEVGRLDEDTQKVVADLWRVPLEGAPVRLTHGPWSSRSPAFRHDGALCFLSDRPFGREEDPKPQVWALAGGDAVRLTDEPLGVSVFRVASRADCLALLAPLWEGVALEEQGAYDRERSKKGPSVMRFVRQPVRHWDQWVAGPAPHLVVVDEQGRRDLTPAAGDMLRPADLDLTLDLSADGRTVVVPRQTEGADRMTAVDLWVFDVATGEGRVLGSEANTWLQGPVISPDGARVACTRHRMGTERHGRLDLWLVDLASGEGRPVQPGLDLWLTPHSWDGDALLCTADERGDVPVYRVDDAGAVRLTGEGSHLGLRALPGAIAGIRHRVTHPPEPFVLRAGGEPELLGPLTGFDATGQVTVERLEVPVDDGEVVRGLLVRPQHAGVVPTLLWIHGGPVGQFADGWHWRWSPLVFAARGYAVALPNPRGSSGAGQAFVEGIWGNTWGGRCYQDVMAVADHLAGRSDLDGARMAAMGGSFGGYMTNWIGSNTDRFRCLVTHASLYHLSAFWGVTDHPSYFQMMLGDDPLADPRAFERYSPHTRIRAWRSPTLILHGEKDYRVPIGEALALFEALQTLGVPSELVVFPDENHWILRPRNVEAWYGAIQAFLARHGMGPGAEAQEPGA